MRVGLLQLDATPPLDDELMQDLNRYLSALLQVEIQVCEVPELPIAPKGWQALMERARSPLRSRSGRPGSGVEKQLFAPHLLECMKRLKEEPTKFLVPEAEDVTCILGLTSCEFFYNTEGLLPDEPVPEDRTRTNSFSSAHGVGACTIARLEGLGEDRGPNRRKFVRQLLPLVGSAYLELLGLRSCQLHTCLAYRRPFSVETTGFNLCPNCEEALLKKTWEGKSADICTVAADRYQALGDVLQDLGQRLEKIRFSRRSYFEFEEDCDWLHVAEEILRESAAERRRALPGGSGTCRRRSLLNCLRRAHEDQPHRTLKRTFTQPLLTRTCLVDMTQSAPYRHDCGDLKQWTLAVTNRKHESGGHYVELGGSLRQKRIGSFVDSGLNGAMARSGQARLKSTMELMPATWSEQKCVLPPLPSIRKRA